MPLLPVNAAASTVGVPSAASANTPTEPSSCGARPTAPSGVNATTPSVCTPIWNVVPGSVSSPVADRSSTSHAVDGSPLPSNGCEITTWCA